MIITFRDGKLKLDCNDFSRAQKQWGKPAAVKLIRHLSNIDAAASFADLWKMKHLHLEELRKRKGKRHGQWSIVVHGGLRIIFFPRGNELTWRDPSGNYLWTNMTEIEVIEVTDYHDE